MARFAKRYLWGRTAGEAAAPAWGQVVPAPGGAWRVPTPAVADQGFEVNGFRAHPGEVAPFWVSGVPDWRFVSALACCPQASGKVGSGSAPGSGPHAVCCRNLDGSKGSIILPDTLHATFTLYQGAGLLVGPCVVPIRWAGSSVALPSPIGPPSFVGQFWRLAAADAQALCPAFWPMSCLNHWANPYTGDYLFFVGDQFDSEGFPLLECGALHFLWRADGGGIWWPADNLVGPCPPGTGLGGYNCTPPLHACGEWDCAHDVLSGFSTTQIYVEVTL